MYISELKRYNLQGTRKRLIPVAQEIEQSFPENKSWRIHKPCVSYFSRLISKSKWNFHEITGISFMRNPVQIPSQEYHRRLLHIHAAMLPSQHPKNLEHSSSTIWHMACHWNQHYYKRRRSIVRVDEGEDFPRLGDINISDDSPEVREMSDEEESNPSIESSDLSILTDLLIRRPNHHLN